jgi:uncharacterized LabA/DUF88 family protein
VSDEIALFIDFENIRYSLINVQHREPDPQELIGVARQFGTVMVARAYADWGRQPDFFKGSLTAAMIDRVDCPAKVRERFRQSPGYSPAPYDRAAPNDQQMPDDEEFIDDEQHLDEPDMETGAAAIEDTQAEVMDEAQDSDQDSDEDSDEEFAGDEGELDEEPQPRMEPAQFNGPSSYYAQPQQVITQSTVDLNMLMDIIETVFDRPSITTFVLMSGDRDFTRICARLKLRLNKRVIVVGVPGTVSRDLISAAEQFIPLGFPQAASAYGNGGGYMRAQAPAPYMPQGPVEPEESGFIQFLDYIDRHWSWRTISGIANFIGDPFNPKNRFRGRLTRDSARDLLRICLDENILIMGKDAMGGENLILNREHPAVAAVLDEQQPAQ